MTSDRVLRSHSTLARNVVHEQARSTVARVDKRPCGSVQPSIAARSIRSRKATSKPYKSDKPRHTANAILRSDQNSPVKIELRRRVAAPHGSNAILATPDGSHLIRSTNLTFPTPLLTTDNVLDRAIAHLISQDPRLKPITEQHYCHAFSPEGLSQVCDPFSSLVTGIMAQQVSGAAASSIRRKFVALFQGESVDDTLAVEERFPAPAKVAQCSISFLRKAGLSERKAEYVQGLATRFANGELSADMLINASDEEIMERLTAVRGLGKWSVEMFACFGLKRLDILSTGDLGVQRGMAALMGKDVSRLKAQGGGKWKYLSEKEMVQESEKFAPYRSIFMWYMWRIEDIDISAMQSV